MPSHHRYKYVYFLIVTMLFLFTNNINAANLSEGKYKNYTFPKKADYHYKVVLEVKSGDCDLYGHHAGRPTSGYFHRKSELGGQSDETIEFNSTKNGTYYLSVYASSNCSFKPIKLYKTYTGSSSNSNKKSKKLNIKIINSTNYDSNYNFTSISYGNNYQDQYCERSLGGTENCGKYLVKENKFSISYSGNTGRTFFDVSYCYEDFAQENCVVSDISGSNSKDFVIYSDQEYQDQNYVSKNKYAKYLEYKENLEEDLFNIVELYFSEACYSRGSLYEYYSGFYTDVRNYTFGQCMSNDGSSTSEVSPFDLYINPRSISKRIKKLVRDSKSILQSLKKLKTLRKFKTNFNKISKKIPRNMRIGMCGEALVNLDFKKKGYKSIDTDIITNGSGHGIDHIFTKNGKMIFVETKANTSRLSKLQRKGGKAYILKQLTAMKEGLNGNGRFKVLETRSKARTTIDEIKQLMRNSSVSYQHINIKLDNIDDGCSPKNGNLGRSIKYKTW